MSLQPDFVTKNKPLTLVYGEPWTNRHPDDTLFWLFLLFPCGRLATLLAERCLWYLCFTICKMGFFPHIPSLPSRDAVGFSNGCDVIELIGSPPPRTMVISSNKLNWSTPKMTDLPCISLNRYPGTTSTNSRFHSNRRVQKGKKKKKKTLTK